MPATQAEALLRTSFDGLRANGGAHDVKGPFSCSPLGPSNGEVALNSLVNRGGKQVHIAEALTLHQPR